MAYWVRESTGLGRAAVLGGLLGRGRGSGSRYLSVELRVGDHDLDNTNFMDFGRLRSRVVREGFPVSLPLRERLQGAEAADLAGHRRRLQAGRPQPCQEARHPSEQDAGRDYSRLQP